MSIYNIDVDMNSVKANFLHTHNWVARFLWAPAPPMHVMVSHRW